MKYKKLGKTDIDVSVICLGTMTYGEQNSETEAHEQLDFALDKGINFLDTAELYAVPGRPETQGLTEKYIGSWFKKSNKRQEVILATKVTGPSPNLRYISDNLGFSRSRIKEAVELSLRRLQTDYIDLYQLHWPERSANFFGQRGYIHHTNDPWKDNFPEVINTLNDLIKEGKIRHWGLSNETPWGLLHTARIASQQNKIDAVSIQNPYSLLNRTYEIGMAEISIRENKGLLAYSPLAFGMLSGKYHEGKSSSENRLNQFGDRMNRYSGSNSRMATEKYVKIARDSGISPTQMALSFVCSRPFVTSAIIGATSISQLSENIESINIELNEDVLKSIEEVQSEYPNPAP